MVRTHRCLANGIFIHKLLLIIMYAAVDVLCDSDLLVSTSCVSLAVATDCELVHAPQRSARKWAAA